MTNSKTRIRTLAECAILIALGTALSVLQIPLPFGGGVTPLSMLPLIIICYRHGPKWGFPSALIFSFLQMIVGVSTVSALFLPGDSQMIWWRAVLVCLLDYVTAYTVIGVASFFRKGRSASASMCAGAAVGLSLRYLAHIVSGSIFYGAWAEWFFTDVLGGDFGAYILGSITDPTALAIVYSITYNGLYMIPEIILTVIAAAAIGKLPFISKGSSMDTAKAAD